MPNLDPIHWITTHWPPLVDRPHVMNVYVQDKHISGCAINRGDFILFYEFKGGPILIHPDTGRRVRRHPGREGVVRAPRVASEFRAWDDGRQTYADGTTMNWKWQAEATCIADGLVPRERANEMLGHAKGNRFRGLNGGKGFQKIGPGQYAALLSLLSG
jgi:hypothetical protein